MSNFSHLMHKHRWTHRRDLVRELVVRNIKIRYKGSVLGVLWSLLHSVLQVRIFAFLFRTGLGDNIPNFPAYVFVGILVWNWFQSSLSLASDTITGNREFMRRPGFPLVILPVVIVATNLFDFLIAFPILLIFIVAGGTPLTPALAIVPVLMFLQFLLTVGLAFLFATFQVSFRDTRHILTVVLRLGFFLAPIIYDPVSRIPARFMWLYRLNPAVRLLEVYRSVLLDGTLPEISSLLIIAGLSLVFLPLGYRVFTRAKYRFLEEI